MVARAIVQIKTAIDATIELGGTNYVFWGGKEGYMSLLNTDMKREKHHLGIMLQKARDYGRAKGFKGTFLIEPKPMEPTKHEDDTDVETILGFLKRWAGKRFQDQYRSEPCQHGGHTFEHELQCAADAGIWIHRCQPGRLPEWLGYWTSSPLTSGRVTQAMLVVLQAGGLNNGGVNFDAHIRRNSTDLQDLVIAHIAGMDTSDVVWKRQRPDQTVSLS